MQTIPKTAAGFEKDFNQLKKDSKHIYQYLMNIPLKTVESLFKNTEIQYEMFTEVLSSLVEHGLKDEVKKVSDFLIAWSKASSFDMTLMFLEDAEKQKLARIATELSKVDKGAHAGFKKVYIDI